MVKEKKKTKNSFFSPDLQIPAGKSVIGPVDPTCSALGAVLLRLAAGSEPLTILAPDTALTERLLSEMPLWFRLFQREPDLQELPESTDRPGHTAAEADAPRTLILSRMLNDPPEITVASVGAALSPAPSPETLRSASFVLKPGMTIPLMDLAERLVKLDYDDETEVTVPGEFARRGGLMDIFSFSSDSPARIEFFGDEVETIRLFDPATQLTTGKTDEYRVVMRSSAATAAMETDRCDFLDFCTGRTRLLIVYPELCRRHLERYYTAEAMEKFDRLLSAPSVLRIADEAETASLPEATPLPCYPVNALIRAGLPDDTAEGASLLMQQWNSGILARWLDDGVRIRIAGKSESDLIHIRQWLTEAGLEEDGKQLTVEVLEIPCGLYMPDQKQALLTGSELFGATPKNAPRRIAGRQGPESETATAEKGETAAFADLDEGDYAVHIQHGICIYRGLTVMKSAGGTAEMLALEFDDDAMMYVPLWQAHCVSRYIGSKKTAVHLSRLATAKWGKTKAAAARSVQSLAYSMLRMQAVRNTVHSRPYPKDDLAQKLFEEAFPFRETADQLRAAEEIKRDMESGKPMDRLLCGDVGFGKTELAMRAAFKAVSAGRQVAVLVPTTVLAQQHYYSFLERFTGTPVIIEQLSRFRSKAEQNEILKKLHAGTIDIVIGTHRLVQEDVRFRDLGLIVIDEEQRFGVIHKERLKKLRVTADVLTMTATPIPRTLYLSMSGMRDLSTIMSAPVQRLPIRTIVAQYETSVIHTAIARELERGGQVYYLHNRVATIEDEAAKINAMFPEARVGIGHGKMDEHELEDVMSRFIEGKLDILVCTTIVESGLDIPNANTIIIDRADRFGLAELYQLRGRVGRWTRQAYAYMLLPKSGILTGDARKRISAIRSYTHLGAGFKLAVRDLEIRGSGNILSTEQSGQIHAIGFHLYCELLRSCVAQLKGESLETPPDVEVFMDFLAFASDPPKGRISACFPDTFINAPRLRIDAYRRLAAIATERRLDDFESELRDRYGKLPDCALRMLDCARLRILAAPLEINSIECRDDRIYLMYPDGSCIKPGGMVPRLKPSDPPEQKLHAVLELVRQLRKGIKKN